MRVRWRSNCSTCGKKQWLVPPNDGTQPKPPPDDGGSGMATDTARQSNVLSLRTVTEMRRYPDNNCSAVMFMKLNKFTQQSTMRFAYMAALSLLLACMGRRLFYVHSELPKLNEDDFYAVTPGPWDNANVPIVYSEASDVPDDLVIPTLKALMALPGARVKCDPSSAKSPPHAAEYCLAIYKTPKDWRASWPVRSLVGEASMCDPPYGGVEDEDFGREIAVVGFAHNHPCGKHLSSPDLGVFPVNVRNAGKEVWELVVYAETPTGNLARNSNGELIPTSAWLATYHLDEPRFYKWDPEGSVFIWNEGSKEWEFRSRCEPQSSAFNPKIALEPKCHPEIN